MTRLFSSLHMFFSGAWLAYRALFTWATPRNYFFAKVLTPLTFLVFSVYLGMAASGTGSANFYLIGNALQMTTFNGIYGMSMVIGLERENGTLMYISASPANRGTLLLGRTFFNILDGYITVVICLLGGVLLGLNLAHANFPGLALTIVIVSMSICGLGVLLGSISLLALNVMFVNNTVFFLLLLFSGANIPLGSMPGWMQMISGALPLTHGIEAARKLTAGASLLSVWSLLTEELLIGVVYLCIGFVIFRWFEFSAKQRGTLEAF